MRGLSSSKFSRLSVSQQTKIAEKKIILINPQNYSINMSRSNRECKPSTSKATVHKRQMESSDDNSDSDSRNATLIANNEKKDLTHLVTNFVKYVLNYSSTKNPIKRSELTSALNIPPKDVAAVCKEGIEILKNVYGLDLVEVPESKSGKQYMTCSTLPNVSSLVMPLEQRRETTVLFIILAYTFMKGGDVLEGELEL